MLAGKKEEKMLVFACFVYRENGGKWEVKSGV